MWDISQVTPYTIDPPPHDRSYFQDHIIAVHNYYQAASKGKLNITGTVFPLNNQSVYLLPREMGYYNPNTSEEENNYRLAQLFTDAINIADSDPDITFTNYDLITIFHAGVGKDIDLGFDETPQDIPSLYFAPDFFKKALGNDFSGIIVDDGSLVVDRAALLPETESQSDLEIGLTGIFAANIGSHLGMYDLFSPATQASGIGSFGLMDAGLFNVFGLSPAMPCAFSRILMDWDDPVTLNSPQVDNTISRFEGVSSLAPTAYKIAINTNEYYLLEYRGERNINIDSVMIVLSENREKPPTYLEILKTYLPERIKVSDSTGVLLKIDNYDWGLPGAGILIWHIDDSIIKQKGSQNAINDDKENRAVDLEEADGSQDIGYSYSLVEAGYQSELGTWLDFWFEDNPAPLYKNEFSLSTSPNTRSNRNYANSHIRVHSFSSNSQPAMRFSYTRDYFNPGFPLALDKSKEADKFIDPILAPVDDLTSALFTSDNLGRIFAVMGNGAGVLYDESAQIAQFSEKELPQLSLMDSNNDDGVDILIATGYSGVLNAFIFTDNDQDSLMDTLFTFNLDERITTAAVVQYPYFYVGTEQGNIYRVGLGHTIDSAYSYQQKITNFTIISPQRVEVLFYDENKPDFPPVIIDLNGDGEYEKIIFSSFEQISINSNEEVKPIDLPQMAVARPAFADIDSDGFYEIFLNLPDKVYGYNFNGALVLNMPFKPVLLPGEQLVGTPLVFDVDGDGASDVVSNTSLGQIFAFNQKGEILAGFPFTLGDSVSLSSASGDINGDGSIDLLTLNAQGDIFSWRLDAGINENIVWWNQATADYTNNHFISIQLEPVSSLVSNLLPPARAYNYPNPNKEKFTNIRYFLREKAQVNIKIFDLAGDLVDSFPGPGVAAIDNEIRWNLENVSSGIYLCRIEANSEKAREVRTIKIMVIN